MLSHVILEGQRHIFPHQRSCTLMALRLHRDQKVPVQKSYFLGSSRKLYLRRSSVLTLNSAERLIMRYTLTCTIRIQCDAFAKHVPTDLGRDPLSSCR